MRNRILAILIIAPFIFGLLACATEHFHKVVTLPELKVHLVSDVSQIPKEKKGYAYKNRLELYVVAYEWQGKIRPDKYILGHEIQHFLNWQSDEIINPDP